MWNWGTAFRLSRMRKFSASLQTNPGDFAELVMKLEGVGTGDSDMYDQVLECVLLAFQKASADAA